MPNSLCKVLLVCGLLLVGKFGLSQTSVRLDYRPGYDLSPESSYFVAEPFWRQAARLSVDLQGDKQWSYSVGVGFHHYQDTFLRNRDYSFRLSDPTKPPNKYYFKTELLGVGGQVNYRIFKKIRFELTGSIGSGVLFKLPLKNPFNQYTRTIHSFYAETALNAKYNLDRFSLLFSPTFTLPVVRRYSDDYSRHRLSPAVGLSYRLR